MVIAHSEARKPSWFDDLPTKAMATSEGLSDYEGHWLAKKKTERDAGWWLSPTHLKNDGVKVSWDDDIPNRWKNIKIHVPNHQPDHHHIPIVVGILPY